MIMDLKIGDTLHHFDRNKYVPGLTDNRGGWVSKVIVGETSKSWVVDGGHKVLKRTLIESKGSYSPELWYTDSQKEDREWCWENKCRITRTVEWLGYDGIDKLRKIDLILKG